MFIDLGSGTGMCILKQVTMNARPTQVVPSLIENKSERGKP
jgi:hypothetical protein